MQRPRGLQCCIDQISLPPEMLKMIVLDLIDVTFGGNWVSYVLLSHHNTKRRTVGVYQVDEIFFLLFVFRICWQGTGPYVAVWCTFGAPVIVPLHILTK